MFSENLRLLTRHFVLSGCLILLGLGQFSSVSFGQKLADPAVDLKTEIEVRDMLQLRDDVGGSIFGDLDLGPGGAELNAEMKGEFEKELTRLAHESRQREQENAQRAEIANASLSSSSVTGSSQTHIAADMNMNEGLGFAVNSPEKVDALRDVARQLESAAWQLEETEAYNFADSIREQANKIRMRARAFSDPSYIGQGSVEMAPVVVASDLVDLHTYLTVENVRIDHWPASIVPEGAVTSIEELEGMVNTMRLSKGSPVLESNIDRQENISLQTIPNGMKVVAIKVSNDDTIIGLLGPGSRIDVIGVFKTRENGESVSMAKTFLKNVEVFCVQFSSSDTIVGVLLNERNSEQLVLVQKVAKLRLVSREESGGDEQGELANVDEVERLLDSHSDKEDARQPQN